MQKDHIGQEIKSVCNVRVLVLLLKTLDDILNVGPWYSSHHHARATGNLLESSELDFTFDFHEVVKGNVVQLHSLRDHYLVYRHFASWEGYLDPGVLKSGQPVVKDYPLILKGPNLEFRLVT